MLLSTCLFPKFKNTATTYLRLAHCQNAYCKLKMNEALSCCCKNNLWFWCWSAGNLSLTSNQWSTTNCCVSPQSWTVCEVLHTLFSFRAGGPSKFDGVCGECFPPLRCPQPLLSLLACYALALLILAVESIDMRRLWFFCELLVIHASGTTWLTRLLRICVYVW